MEWTQVSIVTHSEAVEAITDFIHSMGLYVSIQDPNDVIVKENDWLDTYKFENPDQAVITVYFSEEVNVSEKVIAIEEKLRQISQFVNIGEGKITLNNIKQEDWENNWKNYYKPIKVGENIVIKPVWESYTPEESNIVIELDPGIAFGTGMHETTKLCIQHLEKFIKKDDTVLDIGCGSGILSICSSKLGAFKVIGVDIDPLAVKSSMHNASLNNLTNLEIRQGDLLNVVNEKFDVIVLNIVADVIINTISSAKTYLNKNGTFICSGIIKHRLQDVRESLINCGFNIIDESFDGEWASIVSSV